MNWSKYILMLLPPALRFVRLFALMEALLSPIVLLYDRFVSWKERKKMQLAATPQAVWLPKIVWEEMKASISVEYSDSIPDFWVVVHDFNTDIPRLRTLIERYKLAGKSYNYKFKNVSIVQAWTGFICEKTLEENYFLFNTRIVGDTTELNGVLDYPAHSHLTIIIKCIDSGGRESQFTIDMAAGERYASYFYNDFVNITGEWSVTPERDEKYIYKIRTGW